MRKKGRNRNGAKKVDSKVGIARNAYVKGNFAFAYGYLTLGKSVNFLKPFVSRLLPLYKDESPPVYTIYCTTVSFPSAAFKRQIR